MTELERYRQEINDLDDQLIRLFERRMKVARAVGEYKKERGLPILNLEREKVVLDQNVAKLEDPSLEGVAREYLQHMMDLSKSLQKDLLENE